MSTHVSWIGGSGSGLQIGLTLASRNSALSDTGTNWLDGETLHSVCRLGFAYIARATAGPEPTMQLPDGRETRANFCSGRRRALERAPSCSSGLVQSERAPHPPCLPRILGPRTTATISRRSHIETVHPKSTSQVINIKNRHGEASTLDHMISHAVLFKIANATRAWGCV